jgi:hypothetical protein
MELKPMTDNEQDRAKLQQLNRNYIRSVDEADVAWFDANLAPDFFNTNPDGSFIDRKAFLAQIGRGSSVKNIREHDVLIRILGDFAIIHARTSYRKPDGTEGAGRYTDDWQLRDGRWQCVSVVRRRLCDSGNFFCWMRNITWTLAEPTVSLATY